MFKISEHTPYSLETPCFYGGCIIISELLSTIPVATFKNKCYMYLSLYCTTNQLFQINWITLLSTYDDIISIGLMWCSLNIQNSFQKGYNIKMPFKNSLEIFWHCHEVWRNKGVIFFFPFLSTCEYYICYWKLYIFCTRTWTACPQKYIVICLEYAGWIGNSVEPDQNGVSLHIPVYTFRVNIVTYCYLYFVSANSTV